MRDREEDDDGFQNTPEARQQRRRARRDDDDDHGRPSYEGRDVDVSRVPNHADVSNPTDADFFVPAPPEIGPVESAHTNLTHDTHPMEAGPRTAIVLVGAAIGIAIGVAINAFAQVQEVFWMLPWPTILGGIGALIAYWCTGFEYTCTYVGRDGVARFTCSGRREYLSVEEVFLFRDAFELRASQTRRYGGRFNTYQGTDYSYTWTDIGGRDRYTIGGTHHSEEGTPPPEDAYYFALAAELAWSKYMFDEVERQMLTRGEFRFNLGDGDWVSVGRSSLRLMIGGSLTECSVGEVAAVNLENGFFTVKRTDAVEGWFYSTGVFTFDYGRLANARLFVVALDRYAGLRIN